MPPLWLCVGEGNRKRRRKRKPPAARQLPGRLERTITPCRPAAPESNRAPAPAPAPAPVQPLRPCPARPRRRPPPPYPLPPLPTPPQPARVSGGNQPRRRPLEEDGCDDDDDDEWDDDGHRQDDVVPVAAVSAFVPRTPIPVPPRPVLPRRNRASPSPQRAAPVQETAVIRVPPRPVLARGRKAPAPASSAPGRIEVPPRPRLPMQRMGQTHAKRGEADELGGVCRDGKREAAMREEEQKRSSLAEEVRRKEAQRELKGKAKLTDRDIEEEEEEEAATTTRRQERQPQPHVEAVQHEVQEPLAVFGPQLLGSDSFHADLERQKQIEASLEELRQLRESERWKAIERQRAQGKPARTANVEALGMRHPHGGGVTPRSSSMPAARHTSKASDRQGDTRETPRQEGVFLVRALDHFKGNMRFEHETKGNRKRRQLRFKLHDVIQVTSVNTEDGLYFGTLIKTGKTGWFPYYYVVHLA